MDFIEKLFGIAPDGGDGSLEVLWVRSRSAGASAPGFPSGRLVGTEALLPDRLRGTSESRAVPLGHSIETRNFGGARLGSCFGADPQSAAPCRLDLAP